MSYSDFSLSKVKRDFNLTTVEGVRFLPETQPIEPSPYLKEALSEGLPLATATGSEKARSELIISPILVEVRKILERKISFFSGEDFTVAPELGLSGVCDFLISRSPEQIFIEAPVIVIIAAKKGDLKPGLGQCAAEMIAAQKFNDANNIPTKAIYGSVSSGTAWRFLKLEEQTLTIDFHDYTVPPVEILLGMLVWMVQEG
ncbi:MULTISPECIES: hypothetical protein [unclassified Tolypothrix]|uniref:hypothetical protein n=1 Tax=unclassified Tolypothrix TaxID=2649714 RepID=UPI0005EAAB8B|nr:MULTISPECIES: hypothetical protein [unclassified Tolypothrix]BAY93889.1 hypothetical protein NIES3275_59330 [Microchaete diplosiphon NIES-3275]EKF03398.1 hypothetical protein FDUTEX481_02523 [Tolypothrix sp. PCC 7601]MBE9082072.1 hypothetical protein [Tolypothrix sp. LEGE 11397]UYD27671.1 hypothetical protein HGR01_06285 [Tolypothrix sp. PCC 7712]UYD36468.1 hypothetical protein HG267_12405 [Tolypothrix sp. PCC 7601]